MNDSNIVDEPGIPHPVPTHNRIATIILLSSIYDFLLGIGLLVFYRPLFELFHIRIPSDLIFVQVSGLFLLGLFYFQIHTVKNPERYTFVLEGVIMIRVLYAIIVLGYRVMGNPRDMGIEITGITDFLAGLALFEALWRIHQAQLK